MDYGRDAFYRIDGFSPLGEGLGGQAFSVMLNNGYAKRFYETELNETAHNRLQDIAKKIIVATGLEKDVEEVRRPFVFVENDEGNRTFLLQFVTVPGNACDIGIGGMELGPLKSFFREEEERVKFWTEYGSHNVDSRHQSYALLSCWLAWAHAAEASTIPMEEWEGF